MCHRIPRVGTMRQWTNGDGVPPIDSETRLDTNQPDTPGELAGTDTIPNTAERDATPQPIRWSPEFSIRLGWRIHKRPHPILCHPVHGVIDVMPDHPDEGRCKEIAAIDLSAKTQFDNTIDEYPTVGDVQPKPKIIARGDTVADPPYDHQKGAANYYDFAMISVYDGYPIDVGRVVVDSTRHHWFNLNIDGIEASGYPTNCGQNLTLLFERCGMAGQQGRLQESLVVGNHSGSSDLPRDRRITSGSAFAGRGARRS